MYAHDRAGGNLPKTPLIGEVVQARLGHAQTQDYGMLAYVRIWLV
jgi:hypothetical protein